MKEEIESIMNKAFHTRRGESIIGVKEAAEEISKLIEEERVKAFNTMAKIKPFTGEFENFLLVNALRCLTKEQFKDLTLAMVKRTPFMKLYSIKPLEWECQSPTVWKTKTPDFGSNTIVYFIGKRWDGFACWGSGALGKFWGTTCKEWDEAKAKAQEDWNNRISQYLTEYKEGE